MTIDEYILRIPEERQVGFFWLEQAVEKAFPGANKSMAYKMPTYDIDGEKVVALANQKGNLALYILHYDTLDSIRTDLKKVNVGKSCLRPKKLGEVEKKLISQALELASQGFRNSAFYGKMR